MASAAAVSVDSFSIDEVDRIKECFALFCPPSSHAVTSSEHLLMIMRSLGYAVTKEEAAQYFGLFAKQQQMDFAGLLEAIARHQPVEKHLSADIRHAFAKANRHKKPKRRFFNLTSESSGGDSMKINELRSLLQRQGERLQPSEVDWLLARVSAQSAQQQASSSISHAQLVSFLTAAKK